MKIDYNWGSNPKDLKKSVYITSYFDIMGTIIADFFKSLSS